VGEMREGLHRGLLAGTRLARDPDRLLERRDRVLRPRGRELRDAERRVRVDPRELVSDPLRDLERAGRVRQRRLWVAEERGPPGVVARGGGDEAEVRVPPADGEHPLERLARLGPAAGVREKVRAELLQVEVRAVPEERAE